MEHPLVDVCHIRSMPNDDIQRTISDLYKKLSYAQRSGNNALYCQISMVIESYSRVYSENLEKLYSAEEQNLNSIIDISR